MLKTLIPILSKLRMGLQKGIIIFLNIQFKNSMVITTMTKKDIHKFSAVNPLLIYGKILRISSFSSSSIQIHYLMKLESCFDTSIILSVLSLITDRL